MASIVIKEEDYTKSDVYSPTDTIVYIPGFQGVEGTLNAGIPTLFSSVTEFTAKVGKQPKKFEKIETSEERQEEGYDKSYVMAKQLIASGMTVLYEVVPNVTKVSEMVAALSKDEHWAKLYDRSLYNIRFLTSGGYSAVQNLADTAEPIAAAMIKCAKYDAVGKIGRGDCVALVDHPKQATLEQIHTIFNGTNSFAKSVAGEFAAAFAPWGKFSITTDLGDATGDITEIVAGKEVKYWALPGSFAYLMAYNNMLSNNNPTWFAAAGLPRGVVPTLVAPLIEVGEIASANFQSREEGTIAVNPIVKVPSYGYRIWGTRTLRQITNGLKATSFLNIRNLVSDIKKTSYQACKIVTFEQNTDVMWANLKVNITPLLDKMLSGEGIKGYKIVRVPTTEKAKVVGKIKIVPIEPVEDFELTIQMVDSLETETEE